MVVLIFLNRKNPTDLQLFLQDSGGTLATVLIHHHHHVRQRVHLHLLRLQVVLKLLEWEKAGSSLSECSDILQADGADS